jgi:hypothetical protein
MSPKSRALFRVRFVFTSQISHFVRRQAMDAKREVGFYFEAGLFKLGAILKKANAPPRITARDGGRAIRKIPRSIRLSLGRGGVPIAATRNTIPAASFLEISKFQWRALAGPYRLT